MRATTSQEMNTYLRTPTFALIILPSSLYTHHVYISPSSSLRQSMNLDKRESDSTINNFLIKGVIQLFLHRPNSPRRDHQVESQEGW